MASENNDERRAAFIRALRACAGFLESHPDVTAPRYITINAFVHSRDELATNARAATWEKVYNGDWFYLHRSFNDDLSLDITTERETVCRRIVTGTQTLPAVPAVPEREVEIVEWVCDEPIAAH